MLRFTFFTVLLGIFTLSSMLRGMDFTINNATELQDALDIINGNGNNQSNRLIF